MDSPYPHIAALFGKLQKLGVDVSVEVANIEKAEADFMAAIDQKIASAISGADGNGVDTVALRDRIAAVEQKLTDMAALPAPATTADLEAVADNAAGIQTSLVALTARVATLENSSLAGAAPVDLGPLTDRVTTIEATLADIDAAAGAGGDDSLNAGSADDSLTGAAGDDAIKPAKAGKLTGSGDDSLSGGAS